MLDICDVIYVVPLMTTGNYKANKCNRDSRKNTKRALFQCIRNFAEKGLDFVAKKCRQQVFLVKQNSANRNFDL